ncbi:MAG: 4Fe-4S dicluster domain-containing protein, partial [Acidimicrobiia bacterium]|nr:4Fe-4S dicluster domain-containing protein [Acidimicrobiia bacterium]
PMYLSGAPLHTITVSLLNALMEAMPGVLAVGEQGGDVQVSFSAGINKENLAETLGTGVVPTTICSDLLKPGGYGRLAPMLKRLTEEMTEAGCRDLPAWRAHRHQLAVQAGHRDAVAAHVDAMVNGDENELYSLAGNEKLPREVDHVLEMWGCVACNLCVTVCPNDAFFRLPTPEDSGIDGRQQYFVLMELCNECGNCMTFCPEEGDPAQIKPRLYIDENRFATMPGQGFLLTSENGGIAVTAREGWEAEVPRLHEMLNASEGLPLDASTV